MQSRGVRNRGKRSKIEKKHRIKREKNRKSWKKLAKKLKWLNCYLLICALKLFLTKCLTFVNMDIFKMQLNNICNNMGTKKVPTSSALAECGFLFVCLFNCWSLVMKISIIIFFWTSVVHFEFASTEVVMVCCVSYAFSPNR